MASARIWQVAFLVFSLGFYAIVGTPYLAVVLLAVSVTTFAVGRALPGTGARKARGLLVMGVGANLMVLGVLRYARPILSDVHGADRLLAFLLPATTVGVSYYVLQAIAYLIDVRRGHLTPERDLVVFTLSLAYFPKLLQGPIDRCQRIISQLCRPPSFDYDNARTGLILIALGLCKKLVIADRLAPVADAAFAAPESYHGLPLIIGVYSYAFQIYLDFSGYTDMALGAARLFGVNLTDNFERPYWSSSLPEFWRRWHITLSNWLRDYLFLPIAYGGGRRLELLGLGTRAVDTISYGIAAMGTMIVCGLWHGPRLTFLAWGAVHGSYLLGSRVTRKWRDRVWRRLSPRWRTFRNVIAVALTFHLVAISWVLFRADTLDEAYRTYCSLLPLGAGTQWKGLRVQHAALGYVGLMFCMVGERFGTTHVWIERLTRSHPLVRWSVYYALVLLILFGSAVSQTEFIYFRF
jgi:alginate O-acetyltransferase complex protein AlgI